MHWHSDSFTERGRERSSVGLVPSVLRCLARGRADSDPSSCSVVSFVQNMKPRSHLLLGGLCVPLLTNVSLLLLLLLLTEHCEAFSFLPRVGLAPRNKPQIIENLPSFPQTIPDKNIDDPSSPPPTNVRRPSKSNAPTNKATTAVLPTVSSPHQLRHLVLDQGHALKELSVRLPSSAQREDVTTATTTSSSSLQNHEVVQLLANRFRSGSTPGNRAKGDMARIALCLEGGGMRGAVTAGMAAAIACLGLTDAFDAIYGSSAGSVIGAYLVSRQMCMDVYVDILPAAKRTFVCTKRMVSALAINAMDLILSHLFKPTTMSSTNTLSASVKPGMNISFVLDGVMDDTQGIRPLDVERFRINDRIQPLRIVASCVWNNGSFHTKCFGSDDYFATPGEEQDVVEGMGDNTRTKINNGRRGIYACLEASMTVPGATGPPVRMKDTTGSNATLPFFDAFCFEPLPYRSAVEEGATHALVLCSRPEGFQPVTQRGVYERAVAPLYFRSHQQPQVGRYFEKGGQQYIYAEDLLTLEEGKQALHQTVSVPPPRILYGVERDRDTEALAKNRHLWKKAHLLPLKVPLGTPELPTLEQDRDTVLVAVRQGFAVAFDLLAPAIDLELQGGLTGADVAELIFPGGVVDENVLDKQIRVVGDSIAELGRRTAGRSSHRASTTRPRPSRRMSFLRFLRSVLRRRKWTRATRNGGSRHPEVTPPAEVEDVIGNVLLASLPGLQNGKMAHLSYNLRESRNSTVLLP